MAVPNFPNTPTSGDQYTNNGSVYEFDGVKWVANTETILEDSFVNLAGDTMTGPLELPVGTPSGAQAVRADELPNLVPDSTPVGALLFFPAATIPSGYLACDGSLVSRTTYAALFALVGVTFGAGDGSTTFALPDYRGEFLRGWDNGKGTDSGRAINTLQIDQNKEHNHSINDPGHFHSQQYMYDPSNGDQPSGEGPVSSTTKTTNTGSNTTGITINNSGGTEARPRNWSVQICIKH